MGFDRLFYSSTVVLIFYQLLEGVFGSSCPTHISNMDDTYKASYKGTCYLFVDEEVYWRTARDTCWNLGGEMLTIKDKHTMKFIRDTLNSKELGWRRNGVWLGLNHHRNKWLWTDGTPMSYTNWARGEPSNYLSVLSMEDCTQMRRKDNWKWFDHICGGLRFHFNFICEFPGEVTQSTTTTSTTSKSNSNTKKRGIKDIDVSATKMSSAEGDKNGEDLRGWQNDDNGDNNDEIDKSVLYQQLGHNIYQLMKEKGFSSKSLVKLLQESAGGENPYATVQPEQATSRIASSASNQQEDNGNMNIIIIVVSLSCGFLFILLIIFLLMRRHNKKVKAKAAERAVRYENNYPGRGGTNPPATPRLPVGHMGNGMPGGEQLLSQQQQPPPIPATRPPPIDETYLAPKDINGLYTEVLRPNGTSAHGSNPNNYHVVSTTPPPTAPSNNQNSYHGLSELGRSHESREDCPLISSHSTGSNDHLVHQIGISITTNGPTESCACACVSSSPQDGSEYIAMTSLSSKENISGSREKMLSPEDKHTYSNVHTEGKDSNGVVENLYETLP